MALNFTPINREKLKTDEQKRSLLERAQQENKKLFSLVEAFHEKKTHNSESDAEMCQNIIVAIDGILQNSDCDSSLFLKNSVKPLRALREHANELLCKIEKPKQIKAQKFNLDHHQESILLYISIYQTEGHDLRKWEILLRSIASYLQGRPVYRNEEDVNTAIRARLSQLSEAYIVVRVNKAMIQEEEIQRTDRSGNALITLKSGAVTSDSILELVHMDKRYSFIDGKLN